eukprot:gene16195-biopygen10586
MGQRAGVEIEPAHQTALLDATLRIPGVLAEIPRGIFSAGNPPTLLAGGCPGAGGYDAVYCLCVDEAVRRRVSDAWRGFASAQHGVPAGSVCALLIDEDREQRAWSFSACGEGVGVVGETRPGPRGAITSRAERSPLEQEQGLKAARYASAAALRDAYSDKS